MFETCHYIIVQAWNVLRIIFKHDSIFYQTLFDMNMNFIRKQVLQFFYLFNKLCKFKNHPSIYITQSKHFIKCYRKKSSTTFISERTPKHKAYKNIDHSNVLKSKAKSKFHYKPKTKPQIKKPTKIRRRLRRWCNAKMGLSGGGFSAD